MKQTPNTVIQRFKQPYAAILSFIQRLQSRTNKISVTQATIIPRDEHPISRKIISRAALDVLYGLKDAGYEAYLVGGCLRDALKIGRASCRERVLVLEPAGSLQHDKTA